MKKIAILAILSVMSLNAETGIFANHTPFAFNVQFMSKKNNGVSVFLLYSGDKVSIPEGYDSVALQVFKTKGDNIGSGSQITDIVKIDPKKSYVLDFKEA